MAKKLFFYIGIILFFMVMGGIVWRYTTDRIAFSNRRELSRIHQKPIDTESVLLSVDGREITYEDLEWELLVEKQSMKPSQMSEAVGGETEAISGDDEMNDDESALQTMEGDNKQNDETAAIEPEEDLSALRHKLLSLMVERILLYQAVSQDSSFSIDDPKRFKQCNADAQAMTKAAPDLFKDKKSQQRLRNQLCEKSIIDQYVKEKMAQKIEVSEDEIKDFYEESKEDFHYPTRVAIRQIVLPTENEAKDVRAKLTRTNFAQMAKEFSIAPEAIDGGRLAPFAKGQFPGVFDVAFSMKRGQISHIMKSEYGFHIILLENKMQGGTENLHKASTKIAEILHEQKLRKVYQEWLEKALVDANIKSDYQIW